MLTCMRVNAMDMLALSEPTTAHDGTSHACHAETPRQHARLHFIADSSRQTEQKHAWSKDPQGGRERRSLFATTLNTPCCILFNTRSLGSTCQVSTPLYVPIWTIKGRAHMIQTQVQSYPQQYNSQVDVGYFALATRTTLIKPLCVLVF